LTVIETLTPINKPKREQQYQREPGIAARVGGLSMAIGFSPFAAT